MQELKLTEAKDGSSGGSGDARKGQSGIPTIEFVEDVNAFMNRPENGGEAQIVLKRMEDSYSRMKIIEANNVGTKRR